VFFIYTDCGSRNATSRRHFTSRRKPWSTIVLNRRQSTPYTDPTPPERLYRGATLHTLSNDLYDWWWPVIWLGAACSETCPFMYWQTAGSGLNHPKYCHHVSWYINDEMFLLTSDFAGNLTKTWWNIRFSGWWVWKWVWRVAPQKLLRNVVHYLPDYSVQHPRRHPCS
jgi:hypothetical protein